MPPKYHYRPFPEGHGRPRSVINCPNCGDVLTLTYYTPGAELQSEHEPRQQALYRYHCVSKECAYAEDHEGMLR